MKLEVEPKLMNWNDIVLTVKSGHDLTDEQWEKIDEALPLVAKNPEVVKDAEEFLIDDNDELRDLGASTLAYAKKLSGIGQARLEANLSDRYAPAQFRAAWALSKQGFKTEEVRPVLEAAAESDETYKTEASSELETFLPGSEGV